MPIMKLISTSVAKETNIEGFIKIYKIFGFG